MKEGRIKRGRIKGRKEEKRRQEARVNNKIKLGSKNLNWDPK